MAGGTERMKANKKMCSQGRRLQRYVWQGDYSQRCESGHTFYLPALVPPVLWGVFIQSVYVCARVFVCVFSRKTHTQINFPNLSLCNFFFFLITGSLCSLSASGEEGRRKKKKPTRPGAESYHSQQDVTPIYLSCSCSRADVGVSY